MTTTDIQIVFYTILFFAYFIPAMNAKVRNHRNRGSIFLTNLFFGWTVLGWIVSLIWSASDNVVRPPEITIPIADTTPPLIGEHKQSRFV